MIHIPDEFRENASYFYAGRALEPVNKITSIVLYHVFADSCKEIIENNNSPELKKFVDAFVEKLPPFPVNGPDEVRFVADELYGALQEKLQAGKINSHMCEQFALCSKLYSILDSDLAIIRENKCKYIAARLQVLFRDLERQKEEKERKEREERERIEKEKQEKEAKNMINENDESLIVDEINAQQKGKELHLGAKRMMTSNDIPRIPPSQPTFNNGYDPKHVREYLSSIGIDSTKTKAPQYNENIKNVIQKYLDLGTSCIKRGDKEMALEFLQKARKTWITGHDV